MKGRIGRPKVELTTFKGRDNKPKYFKKMKYGIKAVYNPLKEDFKFEHDGEEFIIPSKGIALFPEIVVPFVVKALVNAILWSKDKEVDDLEGKKYEVEILSHRFTFTDLDEVKEEKTTKKDKPKED